MKKLITSIVLAATFTLTGCGSNETPSLLDSKDQSFEALSELYTMNSKKGRETDRKWKVGGSFGRACIANVTAKSDDGDAFLSIGLYRNYDTTIPTGQITRGNHAGKATGRALQLSAAEILRAVDLLREGKTVSFFDGEITWSGEAFDHQMTEAEAWFKTCVNR